MKTNTGDVLFQIINITFLVVFALLCLFPFYYVFINSISDNRLVTANQIRIFPRGIHLRNYVDIFQVGGLGRSALVSLARTVVGSLFTVISATVCGYTLSKSEFWCRKFWYRFIVVTMYFGAGLIPTYLNIRSLGLMNTFWVYVIPAFVSPYNMILTKTYLEGLPQSLEEAAYIDGAGYFARFIKVVLPLAKPIIATIFIFAAVGQWNSYMDTVMYITSSRYHTLQYVLYSYLNRSKQLADVVKMGGTISEDMMNNVSILAVRYTITSVTVLPILFVYPFFQRYFTKGIMIGAIKG